MRIGLVARGDDTGLGVQTTEVFRHLRDYITSVLIIDICHLSPKTLVLHRERFGDGFVDNGGRLIVTPDVEPASECLGQFLDGVDIVYTAETPYAYELFDIARQRGIKTVLHVNAEFNDYVVLPNLPRPSLFAAPTAWMYDSIPEPKALLPVPIALDRFGEPRDQGLSDIHTPPVPRPHFLHVVGHPAAHDRAGTKDLLAALPFVTQDCNLTIKAQDTDYLATLGLDGSGKVGNVTVVVDTSSPSNYWELYTDAPYAAMVLPRRYGGLCLPMNEAMAAGIPVIMPNIPPNDDQLPTEWLVPAHKYGKFMARQQIDLYRTRPRDLAAALDDFCGPDEPHSFLHYQKAKARALAEVRSWDRLRPTYIEVFASLLTEEGIKR